MGFFLFCCGVFALDEFRHAFARSLAFHLFPAVAVVWGDFGQAYAHVGASFDHRLLRRKGVFRVQVCGVKVADVDLLFFGLSVHLVLHVRHQQWMLDVCSTRSEVTAMKDSLQTWLAVCLLADDFLEEEERGSRAMVC